MLSRRMWLLMALVLVFGLLLELIFWRYPELVGLDAGSGGQFTGMVVTAVTTMLLLMLLVAQLVLGQRVGEVSYRQVLADDVEASSGVAPQVPEHQHALDALTDHLSDRHGRFWKRRVGIYLVVGDMREVEAIAPRLMRSGWMEDQGTLLLGVGLVDDQAATADLLRSLRPRRPLDGIVWALSPVQGADPDYLDRYQRQLQALARQLRWQAPVHLWEVRRSDWVQPAVESAVGCALPLRASADTLERQLSRLLPSLREQGLARMQLDNRHDGLLRLARELQSEGIDRWQQAWARLRRGSGVMLRGLWFSLPLPESSVAGDHHWRAHPAWRGVLAVRHPAGRTYGWTWPRIGSAALLGLLALCGLGLVLSFVSNRAQVAEMQAVLATLDQPREGDAQLLALNELVHELDRLDHRAKHGVPWYQRFGLSQNDGLLAALWPRYVAANNRLIRDPAAASLERELRELLALPPESRERAIRARDAYAPLKAYLMMARPGKADAAFLGKTLAAYETERAGVADGLWQGVAPNLWRFYAEHLAEHPEWRIEEAPGLVAESRQLLIGQLGQRNGEANLYRQVLQRAANQYPSLGLAQLVGDTDAQLLFSSAAEVPGVFTRQAWEGTVRQAIDDIAAERREEIDWVLSDDRSQIAAELTPEVLRERLVQRYFQAYGQAWLEMLNSLRWREAQGLADTIDQLTLMTDVRQSPLIALVNTLAYQGQAGARSQALGDSLLQSAQNLIGQDKAPVLDQLAGLPKSPLDESFGPLLALLGKADDQAGIDDSLSLQAFLTRVTRVRLKLQQISAAPDPQAMVQALAQTVFQGRSVDLTDTQAYGSLMAASLGSDWSGFGQALFVQPLDQAWRKILQPSAAGLNGQWQRAIVTPWNNAFAGRYPFVASGADSSLPMLGQMIRADTGRIDQFLTRQLAGVLRKEGNRWVADTGHSQGLRFNPEFLDTINRLGELADVLYTDGGMGIAFDLRAKPVRDLVQTSLVVDGNALTYFNQRERWQRFEWPGTHDHPGTRLSWIHTRTGERLFGDYPGTWGLIRLLEQAKVTPLDDSESRYRLRLDAPDGLGLTWHLRTELGAGPLALLQLRGLKLPAQIFLDERAVPLSLTQNGAFP